MIAGEDELVLQEAEPCVTVLKGYSRSPHVGSAASRLQAAIKMLHIGLQASLSDHMLTRLRVEALVELNVLVELGTVEPT